MAKKPNFNQKFYDNLLAEGHNPAEAARIASTEMEGAYTTKNGSLDANQTYCNNLDYDEGLPLSKGQQEGESKTKSELAEFFGSSKEPKELNKKVNEWIENESGLRK